MSDNKQYTGEPDRSFINTGEDYEVKYWSTEFAVSSEELIDAVKAVGTNPLAVETYLQNKKDKK